MIMNRLLMPSPVQDDDGALVGRDPRKVTKDEWLASEMPLEVGLRAIRAKCLDCAVTTGEISKCVCTDCPLWPIRMGSVPKGFREAREHLEEIRPKGEMPPGLERALAEKRARVEADPLDVLG
jgi:hypothetical protein